MSSTNVTVLFGNMVFYDVLWVPGHPNLMARLLGLERSSYVNDPP